MERLTEEGTDSEAGDAGPSSRWPWTAPAAEATPYDETPAAVPARLDWLARTIEAEIIPRLLLAHRMPELAADPAQAGVVEPDTLERFCAALLGADPGAPMAQVQALLEARVPAEHLLLDLLAPAARRLGALWEVDLCDFSSVTLGLWRVQQVMHELSPGFQQTARVPVSSRHSVLLSTAPGSQHTLGLLMVAEFFQRAGWDVEADPCIDGADLVQRVRRRWFDVIGFSLGSECHVDPLASVILAARQASRNRAVKVMVGGPVLLACPELVSVLGADGTAADAPAAVRRAEQLVVTRHARPH